MSLFSPDWPWWPVVNTLATVASAVGTFAAVVVALRLARRDKKPDLSVHCAVMKQFVPGIGAVDPSDYVVLTATNVGYINVTVKGVFWQIGRFRKQTFIRIDENNAFSTPLPREISHGQQVVLAWKLSSQAEGNEAFLDDIKGKLLRYRLISSLRVGVYTSVGAEFSAPADNRVKQMLRDGLELRSKKSK